MFAAPKNLNASQGLRPALQALVPGWLFEVDAQGRLVWIQGHLYPNEPTSVAPVHWAGQQVTAVWPAAACGVLLRAVDTALFHQGGVSSTDDRILLPCCDRWESLRLSLTCLSPSLPHCLGWIQMAHPSAHDLTHMAFFDALTGLPNRRLLHDRMEQVLHTSRRTAQWGAVLFLDMDGFKRINDQWGHAAGDDVLRQVAQRLSHAIRKTDTAARLGGDEFVVLLSHLGQTLEAAEHGVQRVVTHLLHQLADQTYQWRQQVAHLSASVGVRLFHGPKALGLSVETLLEQADQAMYRAKAAGRNTWCSFVDIERGCQ